VSKSFIRTITETGRQRSDRLTTMAVITSWSTSTGSTSPPFKSDGASSSTMRKACATVWFMACLLSCGSNAVGMLFDGAGMLFM